MMCCHLARWMDSMVPEKKKKNHFLRTVPEKIALKHCSYALRVSAIYKVPIMFAFFLQDLVVR